MATGEFSTICPEIAGFPQTFPHWAYAPPLVNLRRSRRNLSPRAADRRPYSQRPSLPSGMSSSGVRYKGDSVLFGLQGTAVHLIRPFGAPSPQGEGFQSTNLPPSCRGGYQPPANRIITVPLFHAVPSPACHPERSEGSIPAGGGSPPLQSTNERPDSLVGAAISRPQMRLLPTSDKSSYVCPICRGRRLTASRPPPVILSKAKDLSPAGGGLPPLHTTNQPSALL